MKAKELDTLLPGLFILLVLFGDTYGGDTFKWFWVIGWVVVFLFFVLLPDDNKPRKFVERD